MILLCSPAEAEIHHTRHAVALAHDSKCCGQRVTTGNFCGLQSAVATVGVGKAMSAAVTAALIARYRPRAVVLGGVAGGLDPSLSRGDIVAGAEYLQWDMNAAGAGIPAGVIPRSHRGERRPAGVLQADPQLLQCLPGSGSLRRGVLLTGDTLVTDPGEKRRLWEEYGAAAVDMESAAAALAAALAEVPFLALRCIMDTADGSRPGNIRSFTDTASVELLHLWEKLLPEYLSSGETRAASGPPG